MNELDVLTVGYHFELIHMGIAAAGTILVAVAIIVFGKKLFPVLDRKHARETEGKLLIFSFILGSVAVSASAVTALLYLFLAHFELANLAQSIDAQDRMRGVEEETLTNHAFMALTYLSISVGIMFFGGFVSMIVEMKAKLENRAPSD